MEPESSDLTLAHVLLTGPEGTPYANGFFYFRVRFPQDYPQNPPTVKLCTTGGGVVRFNPNLYANGKVCLSLLGTWSGPGWTPLNTLTSVLVTVQSIMNAAPLHNEPGWEEGTARATLDAVADYTQYVRHETIRVAVLDNVLKADAMPESLRESMLLSFLELKDFYVSTCQAHCHWDGRAFNTPWKAAGTFMFGALAEKIKEAAMRVESGELS